MTSDPGWTQIVLRPALATLAEWLFGMDRGERRQAAGLRTTMLVCRRHAAG